jgi:hypothetical protein
MRALAFVSAVVALTGWASLAAAEDAPPPPRTVVLADLGLHVIGVGVQRTVTRRVALQAALDWYVPWTADETGETLGTMGAVVRLRPVIHLIDGAPEGLWLSPFVQLGFVRADRAGEERVGPAGALGASLGWAWLVADHLHLSLGAGAQIHGAQLPGGDGAPSFYGPWPHLDGTIGYAF